MLPRTHCSLQCALRARNVHRHLFGPVASVLPRTAARSSKLSVAAQLDVSTTATVSTEAARV